MTETTTPSTSYRWTLKDGYPAPTKGKVFSCFAGGGGSTMGYKRAGFEVVGCNEIDPRQMVLYQTNHVPKYAYTEPIQTFKCRDDLPGELYQLDILDGSPPCSSFSIAGARERDWGRKKHFREGQQEQVLDTLFFDFIDLAKKLQPKVVVAENVIGLLYGNAKKYVLRIYHELELAGYSVQHHVLNGATMGLPQARERVFFIALRCDLVQYVPIKYSLFDTVPILKLEFSEEPVPFGAIRVPDPAPEDDLNKSTQCYHLWTHRQRGDRGLSDPCQRLQQREAFFKYNFAYDDQVLNTLVSDKNQIVFDEPRWLNAREVILASSFPMDYDFQGLRPEYVCGMSVPPLMMMRVADEIGRQWIDKINKKQPTSKTE